MPLKQSANSSLVFSFFRGNFFCAPSSSSPDQVNANSPHLSYSNGNGLIWVVKDSPVKINCTALISKKAFQSRPKEIASLTKWWLNGEVLSNDSAEPGSDSLLIERAALVNEGNHQLEINFILPFLSFRTFGSLNCGRFAELNPESPVLMLFSPQATTPVNSLATLGLPSTLKCKVSYYFEIYRPECIRFSR